MKVTSICLAIALTTATAIAIDCQAFNSVSTVAAQSSPTHALSKLQTALKSVDLSTAQGRVGIGVLDLTTKEQWFHNGSQPFPMQSVYKLPIAIAVLKQVDEGKRSLNQLVTITRQDFAPGFSPITKEFKSDRAQFTVQNLLERAVGLSDNTASDALVRLLGGPKQVTAQLRQLTLQNLRIDRLEQQMQPDSVGLKNPQPEWVDEKTFTAVIEKTPSAIRKTALDRYLIDPRDTATPKGIIDLLAKLQTNQLLSRNTTALLLQIMTNSPTGKKRLKAGLPKDWSIAHKTGTGLEVLGVGTATNDVGILTAPNGKQFAIAVFIAGSKAPIAQREQIMANIAAAVVQTAQ